MSDDIELDVGSVDVQQLLDERAHLRVRVAELERREKGWRELADSPTIYLRHDRRAWQICELDSDQKMVERQRVADNNDQASYDAAVEAMLQLAIARAEAEEGKQEARDGD